MVLKFDTSRILAAARRSGFRGICKVVAIILALINLKNLPFAWHLRLFNGLLTHLIRRSVRLNSITGPRALFQPIITSSYSPLLECDYNMHKSNATYFSDLDISRTHLLTALCGNGIDHVRKEMAVKKDDRFSIMLGGVSCTFRREIKPYQPFEIWSRVLCWDRKWLYIVSHFVKKGDVKPMGYTLRPRKTTAAVGGKTATKQESNGKPNMHINIVAATHPAIFASGISKYVFKKGRLTIPPERILDASNLLPAKPAGHHTPPMTPSPLTSEGSSLFFGTASVLQDLDPRNVNEVIDASLLPGDDDEEVWNWTMAENERLRGMKIAELMAGLDSLHEEFTAEKTPALGEY